VIFGDVATTPTSANPVSTCAVPAARRFQNGDVSLSPKTLLPKRVRSSLATFFTLNRANVAAPDQPADRMRGHSSRDGRFSVVLADGRPSVRLARFQGKAFLTGAAGFCAVPRPSFIAHRFFGGAQILSSPVSTVKRRLSRSRAESNWSVCARSRYAAFFRRFDNRRSRDPVRRQL